MDIMPARVWLRKCGGGFTLPGGKRYLTVVGDDRELPRHVEYVRADNVADLFRAAKMALDCARSVSPEMTEAYAALQDALSKAEGHIGQELAPDANGDEG